MRVGIEAINFYVGKACFDVRTLFERRGLNLARFDNLMMRKKSVAMPFEDPVTHAVNAANSIVSALTAAEKSRIEMVIVASESGLDFGKSLSTYVHHYLALPKTCRLFEVKQACYGATAALQMAASFVVSQASPGAKVLVIASDTALHTTVGEGGGKEDEDGSFAEPSSGTGAVAFLVSDQPAMFELDFGATGLHSYEVMDTCRPVVGLETGDSDLSLLSYLDCFAGAFAAYCDKVDGADLPTTFDYLAFHTPFPGMVKGAHRKAMRERGDPSREREHERGRGRGRGRDEAQAIEADFERRVLPSLRYCVDVGNLYSGALYLALAGVIAQAPAGRRARVGMFSYGSGCSSEFFSGVVGAEAATLIKKQKLDEAIGGRTPLEFGAYEEIGRLNRECGFGVRDHHVIVVMEDASSPSAKVYSEHFRGKGLLVLDEIRAFHRRYRWS